MATLLITGGTGSFGNAALRRFLKDDSIDKIIVFSRDEKKQHDMRQIFDSPKIEYIVGDVRDFDAIKAATKGVDYIFHAAALKHVPTGEFFATELIKTNIFGTENVLRAAEENNVKKVVILSTDKAVYPINAMGMSKALAEKLLIGRHRKTTETISCGVRYGNVMASRGSVIPLFVDCIKNGKPITITDPNMTRFLLSLDDSIDLVHLAIKKGAQGDMFVKKAPAATIGDLARAMLNIFGANNEVKVVGIRAGEKIHEALATQTELMRAEDMGGFYRIHDIGSEGYKAFYEKGLVKEVGDDYTSANTKRLSVPEIEELLLSLDYIQNELDGYMSGATPR